jgi:mevalonate kinase
MSFKATAPGSLMLLGEYAVLEGGYALVAAVNRCMSVVLKPREDTLITIKSDLGYYECDRANIEVNAPFQFVLSILKKYKKSLPSGCDLSIESEFSDQIGLASSAAVTVATLTALHAWLNDWITNEELIYEAREIVREVQGVGSGADVVACVLGGVVGYCAEPFEVEEFSYTHPLTVVYSGRKTKTKDAIHFVEDRFSTDPDLYEQIKEAINECAQAGMQAVRNNNHAELGMAMNDQQELMEELGVNTPMLKEIIDNLKEDPAILGAKISGSGLGDCVVGLGVTSISSFTNAYLDEKRMGDDNEIHSYKLPDLQIASRGVRCEEI